MTIRVRQWRRVYIVFFDGKRKYNRIGEDFLKLVIAMQSIDSNNQLYVEDKVDCKQELQNIWLGIN